MPIPRPLLRLLAALALLWLPAGPTTAAALADPLVLLAQPGPWPGVSRLVGYQGRVWFANSVKFVNHNSADLYSYDPRSGATRYEAHLFSQDAGIPVVADGRLYWPSEDSRASAGRAEFMVTDGEHWRWRSLPPPIAFHLHALAATGDGTLFAATSAWAAGLQRSRDHGRTWEALHDHPTPPGRVTRFTSLAVLDGTLYVGLSSRTDSGPRLMRLIENRPIGHRLTPVEGWPSARITTGLTVYRGWLYGISRGDDPASVWRTDGTRVEEVTHFAKASANGSAAETVRAMAAGPGALWAVTATSSAGTLMRSATGLDWQGVQPFEEAAPVDVLVYAGAPYVGTIGPRGRGGLWGPPAPAGVEPAPEVASVPFSPSASIDVDAGPGVDLAKLDDALRRAVGFQDLRERVIPQFERLIAAAPSGPRPRIGAWLTEQLLMERSSQEVETYAHVVALSDLQKWYLLRTMGLLGAGRVPLALLGRPWDLEPNRAEKYFHPLPAALWSAARIGRNDLATIGRIIEGLDTPGEPPWLDGDRIGALTALTGERFGYRIEDWRHWWADLRNDAMVKIPAGTLAMGSEHGEPPERPVHRVRVSTFLIDRVEVRNADFAEFVAATGHQTDREREGWGWHWTGQWQRVHGADWHHPEGPDSSIEVRASNPVVQVSWTDARAYCAWRNKRLPSEAEWERAARGVGARVYAWGDAPPREAGQFRASYGSDACCRAEAGDGYLTTAPVASFPAGRSPFGVEDLTGNVWEWVEDSYDRTFYEHSPEHDPVNRDPDKGFKVIRGGGWGNNPAALRTTLRHANRPQFGLSMVGFRCARSWGE